VGVLVLAAPEELVELAQLVDERARRDDALVLRVLRDVQEERAEGGEERRREGRSGAGRELRRARVWCLCDGDLGRRRAARWGAGARRRYRRAGHERGRIFMAGERVGELDDEVAKRRAKVQSLQHGVGVTRRTRSAPRSHRAHAAPRLTMCSQTGRAGRTKDMSATAPGRD
jgi:hypothetical protein